MLVKVCISTVRDRFESEARLLVPAGQVADAQALRKVRTLVVEKLGRPNRLSHVRGLVHKRVLSAKLSILLVLYNKLKEVAQILHFGMMSLS